MKPDISQAFVEKYNQPGPRYTSYPTVPAWKQDFGADAYNEALTELDTRPDDELAIYLHLPFCAKHCHYCGCNALVTREKGAVDLYLDNVEKELAMVTDKIGTNRKAVQIHWGGGTPNFLNEAQTERALGLLKSAFKVPRRAEISLEIDPRIASAEQALFLRQAGFNRISLGVQDFNESTQQAIGRMQSRERTLDVYQGCRDAGFEGVNVDLVYGLPGQTEANFQATLKEIIGLAPDRVACFSYAHVPWVRPDQNKADTTIMLEGYDKFQLFLLTVDLFQQADYTWIGIDHFAKRDDELSVALRNKALHRNFMGYATKPAPHMLAFGLSGIGDVCDRFVQNDPTLDGWSGSVSGGKLPVIKGHKLNRDDRMRRKTILQLMCNLELPFNLTEEEFGGPVDDLMPEAVAAMPPFIADGLVEMDQHGIYITDKGRYFVRNVAMTMDAHLGGGKDKPIFSKTI